MGLLSRVFGEKESPGEQARQARDFIQGAKALSAESPEKAVKVLEKQGKLLYAVLGMGGAEHRAFRELALALWSRSADQNIVNLPTVDVLPWSTWERPTLRDLQASARDMAGDILYCRATGSGSCRDALGELSALRYFAQDAAMVMVTVYEENMLFRKSFILEAAEALDPDLEEIGQGFADFARKVGRKTLDL